MSLVLSLTARSSGNARDILCNNSAQASIVVQPLTVDGNSKWCSWILVRILTVDGEVRWMLTVDRKNTWGSWALLGFLLQMGKRDGVV